MAKRETPPTLAGRVRYLRGLVPGLDMRPLSKIAGLSPSTVGEIERGNRVTLSTATASGLATACGVSLDWLVRGEGPAPDWAACAARMREGVTKLPPRGKSGPKGKAV